jgi:flavin reductase (DIM6/NTAB) family NADH-FMN oxidoreductase RutF
VISPDEFRHTLSHFASGVTVITVCDRDGRPTGLTASAFTSVSLEPPLILVCVDHKSLSYPALVAGKMFAVNALAHLECATVNMHLEGDHSIFVGRVERARVGDGHPLVYFRGRYDRLSGATP